MEQIKRALYQQMRFAVLATAIPAADRSPFSRAYLYAWDREVYPAFDQGAKWHDAHEEQFKVRAHEILELAEFLDERWLAKEPVSFYELEDHYGVGGSARASGSWERWKLIAACRYMFLQQMFDKPFWAALAENGKCPAEALSVDSEREDEIYFQ